MTREGGKILLPVIKAFIEGKTIQHYESRLGSWYDLTGVDLSFSDDPSFYRIKPEQKYRPFKDRNECWSEMHKHSDFGWVYETATSKYQNIIRIHDNIDSAIELSGSVGFKISFDLMCRDFQFMDGSPFGIKEE